MIINVIEILKIKKILKNIKNKFFIFIVFTIKMNIYCGNNRLNNNLVNGTSLLGNRYDCFKKGLGKGLSLSIDENYRNGYEPIDNTRIYCGNRKELPENYDRFGNLPHCLQKGIGVGKRIKIENEGNNLDGGTENLDLNYKKDKKRIKLINLIINIIFSILVFFLLFITKPSFLIKKNKDTNKKLGKRKQIIWYKFIILYIIIILPIWFINF